jgi:hypothetical protein
MPLPGGGLGCASPGNDDENSKTFSRRTRRREVRVPQPKKEAKRSVEKVSMRGGARRKGPEISIPVASELANSLAKIGSPDNRITPQQLSLPFYGNYCGRGHGDPTGNTPPIDAVDAVCREHNRCYRLLGDFDRRCDRDLIESMPSAIARTPSPIGKNAGFLALLYFSLAERNLALGETLFKRT